MTADFNLRRSTLAAIKCTNCGTIYPPSRMVRRYQVLLRYARSIGCDGHVYETKISEWKVCGF